MEKFGDKTRGYDFRNYERDRSQTLSRKGPIDYQYKYWLKEV